MVEAGTILDRGEASLRGGDAAAALQAAESAIRLDPRQIKAHILRANAANVLGELDTLVDSLQWLLLQHPQHPRFTRMLATALNNRGSRSVRRSDASSALADLERAISLWPEHPQAWFNLGLCLRDMGRAEAASDAMERHLQLQPEDESARFLLACLRSPEDARTAMASAVHAERLQIDPGWLAHTAARAGMVSGVLSALRQMGDEHDFNAATEALCELRLRGEYAAAAEASSLFCGAARRAGRSTFRAEMVGALTLPAVYRSNADLLEQRERFSSGLSRLEADYAESATFNAPPALRELAHSNFLLAYQGLPDKQLQVRFASLIERMAGQIRPDLVEAPADLKCRRRIGLISASWRRCTVGAYFGCWIRWIRDAGFEVYLYQLGPQRDSQTGIFAQQAQVFRFFEGSLESIADSVRADKLDLLIYPEMGMDARLTPLAALRLARRQVLAWGHPTTSGFSHFDAYISCALMEPLEATDHYNEPLRLLPGLGVDYLRPETPQQVSPEQFGLSSARPRLLVPQSLFKLHPDTDRVLAGIAERMPKVQLVLFEPEHATWRRDYLQRLGAAFAEYGVSVDRHVVFLPLMSRQRYLQVNLACDLMLDSLHWSGGNTAIDALCCGLPLVACPGIMMRGRQSHAMLERMNLSTQLSVADPAAQAARVVELLDDEDERRSLRAEIPSRLPALFEASGARECLIEHLEALISA